MINVTLTFDEIHHSQAVLSTVAELVIFIKLEHRCIFVKTEYIRCAGTAYYAVICQGGSGQQCQVAPQLVFMKLLSSGTKGKITWEKVAFSDNINI